MERGVVSPGLALLGTACRTCRTFRTTRRVVATSSRRHGSSTAAAEALAAGVDGLPRRPAKFIADYLVPMPSHLLTTTLSDLLTPSSAPPSPPPSSSSPIIQHPPPPLPQGHHLVYFPIQTPPSRLAADGADPDHGPGGPFARRMWAGGEVVFSPRWRERLLLDGRAWACEERVERVDVKGVAGAEKVFVDVRRRYGLGHEGGAREWDIEERRTLVFMRNEEEGAGTQAAAPPRRPIKFPHPASYSISLTPTPTHLFHFSALTFNAHAIHLDTGYARGTDGHRGLLVHGPLTLALMLRVLAEQSAGDGSGDNSSLLNSSGGSRSGGGSAPVGKVRRIAYRNYAPLYVDERMTVCVRRPADAAGSWDVWVEGPDGGLAVKGTVEMERE